MFTDYAVFTDNGHRIYHANDIEHASEQHYNFLAGVEGEGIYGIVMASYAVKRGWISELDAKD